MTTDFDKYIGQRLRFHRETIGVSILRAARALELSPIIYRRSEIGLRRFHASEIFEMKRIFGIPIEDFFTTDGIYVSDLSDTFARDDLTDVIHYFPNILDTCLRASLVEQIKEASSVF